MSELCPDAVPLADLAGDAPVAFIGIALLRSGVMRLNGQIEDERTARSMLDAARATLSRYHAEQERGRRSAIRVRADDTRTVGTQAEKALLAGEPTAAAVPAFSDPDRIHADTPVAFIGILQMRSGMQRIEGSITDRDFTGYMLDTAEATLTNYHLQRRMSDGVILVGAGDTALAGTPAEESLRAARDELADAMAR